MKEFILDKDHKIEVEPNKYGDFIVKFYEYYTACGWRYLSSELYDKESFEWEYGITL